LFSSFFQGKDKVNLTVGNSDYRVRKQIRFPALPHAGPGYIFSWGPLFPLVEGMEKTGNTFDPQDFRLIDIKGACAEMIAMILFVIIGCGTACGHGAFDAATRLVVAFAFGMSIMVLAYATAKHSGAQINGAVTFSLVLGNIIPW